MRQYLIDDIDGTTCAGIGKNRVYSRGCRCAPWISNERVDMTILELELASEADAPVLSPLHKILQSRWPLYTHPFTGSFTEVWWR